MSQRHVKIRVWLTLAVILMMASPLASVIVSYAQVPDTVGTDVSIEATATGGPTLLDKLSQLIAALTPIISLLTGLGVLQKYAPFLSKLPNVLIPYINAAMAFLLMFGPAPAQAGLFGDLVHGLGFGAKLAGSVFVSVGSRTLYEVFLRGWFEKAQIFAAGLSPAQKAAKVKLLNLAV